MKDEDSGIWKSLGIKSETVGKEIIQNKELLDALHTHFHVSNPFMLDNEFQIEGVDNVGTLDRKTKPEIKNILTGFVRKSDTDYDIFSMHQSKTYTMEKMCETLLLLRTKYHFNGYIHVKTIPGASDELLAAAGYLADRISVNMELPTEEGLRTLAPNKTMQTILDPMGKVRNTIASHRMAIGKSAHMERSKGNQFLSQSIFGTESKKQFADGLMKEKKAALGTENVVRDDAGAYGSIDQGKNHGTGQKSGTDHQYGGRFRPVVYGCGKKGGAVRLCQRKGLHGH